MRYHFAGFYNGNHQACIVNNSIDQLITFKLSLQTGVQAQDYSNIVTKKHLKPIELAAQKIQDMVEQLRAEMNTLIISEETLKSENQLIKSRVVTFGVISVVIMALSTYTQITYLKNFFRYKKII